MKFLAFACLLGFTTANIIKTTEVAAEKENINSNENNSLLFSKTLDRAAFVELTGEASNSQKTATSINRRSSNEIDGYIEEFKRLEEQYCNAKMPLFCETYEKSKADTKFLPLYESFLDRINKYALTVQNGNDKKILAYLYTATLGRIYNLEDHLESTLVDDIESYFESVKDDIEKLKDLQNEGAKTDITIKYKQNYKTVVNKKITYSTVLISKDNISEIDYIKTGIDSQIENLVAKKTEENDDLRENETNLETAILNLVFLGPLKVLNQALILISRAGEVIGSSIEFGSSLTESFILDNLSDKSFIPNLEDSMIDFKSFQNEIKNFRDQNGNGPKRTLKIVSQVIDKHSTTRKVIQRNEKKIDMLKDYENEIYTTMVPLLEKIDNDLDNIISKIQNKEKVVFDSTKWKVKNTLRKLMFQLQQLTKGFGVQGSLKSYVVKLQDVMFSLNTAQDYIQDYQKHKTLANFIAGVTSSTLNDVDGNLGDTLSDLEVTIRANIVIQRFKVAIDTFKQFIFPFAHRFLQHSFYLVLGKTKLETIIKTAVSYFQRIKIDLGMDKATLTRFDVCKFSAYFYDHYYITSPFFTWKKQTNDYMFSKLLSGEELIVKPNIMEAPSDALKFEYLEFYFKAKKEDDQLELNNVLKGFRIQATYLGDSYYRYKNKIYLMTPATDFSFWHSLGKVTEGKPTTKSLSYDRFKNGNAILSPYATWKIALEKNTDKSSFKDLEKFKNQDDLEFILGGYGRFVDVRGACAELEEDKYYKAIN